MSQTDFPLAVLPTTVQSLQKARILGGGWGGGWSLLDTVPSSSNVHPVTNSDPFYLLDPFLSLPPHWPTIP